MYGLWQRLCQRRRRAFAERLLRQHRVDGHSALLCLTGILAAQNSMSSSSISSGSRPAASIHANISGNAMIVRQ